MHRQYQEKVLLCYCQGGTLNSPTFSRADRSIEQTKDFNRSNSLRGSEFYIIEQFDESNSRRFDERDRFERDSRVSSSKQETMNIVNYEQVD